MTNDRLAENRAAGIIQALTDKEDTTCVDCGERVDLADAADETAVADALEAHREDCPGEWYDG